MSSTSNILIYGGWHGLLLVVGFWQITPCDEYCSSGPLKQNLTSHVGPTTLAVFLSVRYAGDDLVPKFGQGEPWKKVFGPVFIYVNSVMDGENPLSLWDDAKRQLPVEVQRWPYTFPASEDFQSSDHSGNVRGKLLVLDRYASDDNIPANGAYVGLAAPGEVGSWQRECKDNGRIQDFDWNAMIEDVTQGVYRFVLLTLLLVVKLNNMVTFCWCASIFEVEN